MLGGRDQRPVSTWSRAALLVVWNSVPQGPHTTTLKMHWVPVPSS